MSSAVIEAVRDRILVKLPVDSTVGIVWHAGEPTAAPIAWYEKAYECLKPACPPGGNFAMQSNGIAIDERWIDLFRRTHTNVSLSIDGPERFHDLRRRTRNDRPTWHLAMRGLRRLQDAGLAVPVITVLHPDALSHVDEFFDFYRDNGIVDVSFSIDETEAAHLKSSFSTSDQKSRLVEFLRSMLTQSYRFRYPLHIREIERVASVLAGAKSRGNEQVDPWAAITVAANGNVSTFSPELMEVHAPEYKDFVFGNILLDDISSMERTNLFRSVSSAVSAGVALCSSCRYFGVCGGGSPVNKYCERKSLAEAETEFCKLTTQASTDALLTFLSGKYLNGSADV